MKKDDKTKQLINFFDNAVRIAKVEQADAIMVLLEYPINLARIKKKCGDIPLILITRDPDQHEGADELDIGVIELDAEVSPVSERLTQGLLESVAQELVAPGAAVIAVYSAYEAAKIDSISFIRMHEHLGRLTARDLRKIETKVPLEILKVVVDLAIEVGREGREGKPVGTLFVVGDHKKVLEQSHPANFDLVKGYPKKERNLTSAKVREAMKDIAQIDGCFVVSQDGTVEATCRIIDTAPVELHMTTGLGARHYAAAAISKNTEAVAVVVSESNGTVRIFQNGEVMLRIEPFRRAMKFKGLDLPAAVPAET